MSRVTVHKRTSTGTSAAVGGSPLPPTSSRSSGAGFPKIGSPSSPATASPSPPSAAAPSSPMPSARRSSGTLSMPPLSARSPSPSGSRESVASSSPSAPTYSSSGGGGGGSKDNIQVCVRIRPGSGVSDPSLYNWDISRGDTVLTDTGSDASSGPSAPFHFAAVYGPTTATEVLYDRSVQHVVNEFCCGINGSLLAYGQTASGKTHTMTAVTSMAIAQIFAQMSEDQGSVYLLRCSFMEIYTEEVNDLLNPQRKAAKNLAMREVNGAFKVAALTETIVTTAAEVYACIDKGHTHRKVGVSNLNEHSSRSHSIFRLTLESALKTDGSSGGGPGRQKLAGAVKVSELNIVDLAGSETLSYDFGAAQQGETKAINLSLTQLKTVISALAKRESFVPFRNSSLTKLLRNSLGGNSRAVLICTLNPLPVHARTSRNTLAFGQLAKAVTNKARVNEVVDDTGVLLKQQQQQIAKLEEKLANVGRLEDEKARIQKEYAQLQRHLEELTRKQAEQQDLQRQVMEANSAFVGHQAAAVAPINDTAVSSVSEEELAALSTQLSTLQSQKTELEQAKAELEAKLKAQLRTQAATEADIQRKLEQLDDVAAKSEADRAELAAMAQTLKRQAEEDEALNAALAQQTALVHEKSKQSEALAQKLARAEDETRRQEQEMSRQRADMASKEEAMRRLESEQRQQQEGFKMQMRMLEEARAKTAEQEAQMSRLQAEQSAKESRLRAQVSEMEANTLKLQVERADLRNLNAAAQERWKREMLLQSSSGIDKDSYLAQLMDRYEREVHQLKLQVSEGESMRLVQSMATEDEMAQLKRQLKTAQASADQAPQLADRQREAAAAAFAQPSAAALAAASNGAARKLPLLVLPGVVELAESEQLLSSPMASTPPCPSCASRDRLRAEKLRTLCNHARATIDHSFQKVKEQQREIVELKESLGVYELQLLEFEERLGARVRPPV